MRSTAVTPGSGHGPAQPPEPRALSGWQDHRESHSRPRTPMTPSLGRRNASTGARRLPGASGEVGCCRVIPPLSDDSDIGPLDSNFEVTISAVGYRNVAVIADGVLGARQSGELGETPLDAVGRKFGVEMTAGIIHIPRQNVVWGKRQQWNLELVQVTHAPGGRIADQGPVDCDLVPLEIVHHLTVVGFAARFLPVADHVDDAAGSLRPGRKRLARSQDGIVEGVDLLGV